MQYHTQQSFDVKNGSRLSLSERAESFARSIHAHQIDKAGKPYYHHLQAVAGNLIEPSEEIKAVAWLHDSVEDTETTFDDLTHNMDLSRLPVVTEKDLARNEKYARAKAFLEN